MVGAAAREPLQLQAQDRDDRQVDTTSSHVAGGPLDQVQSNGKPRVGGREHVWVGWDDRGCTPLDLEVDHRLHQLLARRATGQLLRPDPCCPTVGQPRPAVVGSNLALEQCCHRVDQERYPGSCGGLT